MPRPPRRHQRALAWVLACALVLGLAGALGLAPDPGAAVGAAPPTVGGTQVFPADNIWNRTVTDLPVHANSAAYLNSIGLTAGLKADFGSGTWNDGPIGIPYITVPGDQPKVPIYYTAYGDESDPGPMPIPDNAPVEWGSDRHVIVIDRDNGILYELFGARKNANGGWDADSGAVWSLKSNALRPDGWTSADAAGLPIFPGLARYDEVASGAITHALRFTIPRTQKARIWPARHDASSSTDPARPPMGLRVRLKASANIAGYSGQARVILQCLKDYGMILADNGSAIYLSGAPDPGWDNDNLALLRNIKASDLEVVDESGLQVAANSAQARPVGGGASPTPAPSPTATTRPSARPSPSPSPSPSPAPQTYTLTVSKQGQGSVAPGSGSHAAGAQVRLVATPAAGWVFKRWRVDGRNVSGTGALTIAMTRNRTVEAVFVRGTAAAPASIAGRQSLTVAVVGAGRVVPGGGNDDVGATILLDALPDPGWTFGGWTVDNRVAGYAATLSVTLDGPHQAVARFAPTPAYPDVPATDPAHGAIVQLGGAGIIRGYADGRFGPGDRTLRAQMAALIARAMGWDAEDHGNPFADQGGVDPNLWRNVGTLAHYGVVKGYGDGTYGPNDPVTHLQAISFITRAFVARGWWAAQPDDPALYPGVPASSGARGDLATFVAYTGPLPGTADAADPWPVWTAPCTRAWFALALQRAVESYWGGTP